MDDGRSGSVSGDLVAQARVADAEHEGRGSLGTVQAYCRPASSVQRAARHLPQ